MGSSRPLTPIPLLENWKLTRRTYPDPNSLLSSLENSRPFIYHTISILPTSFPSSKTSSSSNVFCIDGEKYSTTEPFITRQFETATISLIISALLSIDAIAATPIANVSGTPSSDSYVQIAGVVILKPRGFKAKHAVLWDQGQALPPGIEEPKRTPVRRVTRSSYKEKGQHIDFAQRQVDFRKNHHFSYVAIGEYDPTYDSATVRLAGKALHQVFPLATIKAHPRETFFSIEINYYPFQYQFDRSREILELPLVFVQKPRRII